MPIHRHLTLADFYYVAPVLGDDLYAEMKRPRNHVQWRLPALPPGVLFLHNAHITLNVRSLAYCVVMC